MPTFCKCSKIERVKEYKKLFERSIIYQLQEILSYECPLCNVSVSNFSFIQNLFGKEYGNSRKAVLIELTPIFDMCFSIFSSCDKCSKTYPVTKPMSCSCSPKYCFQCLRKDFFSISRYCYSCPNCNNTNYSKTLLKFYLALNEKDLPLIGFTDYASEISKGIHKMRELDFSFNQKKLNSDNSNDYFSKDYPNDNNYPYRNRSESNNNQDKNYIKKNLSHHHKESQKSSVKEREKLLTNKKIIVGGSLLLGVIAFYLLDPFNLFSSKS